MCNAKALIAVVAVGAALYTGGASLGLLGAGGATGGVAGGIAGGTTALTTTTVSTGLTTAQMVNLGLSAAGTLAGAASAYQGSRTAKAMAEQNAITAEQNAQDALARGEKDAQAVRRQGQQVVGAQRAAFSARGLDISEGTPADVIDQTDFFGQSDAATTRTNARREARAYRAQGGSFQAEAGTLNPWLQGGSALLGSMGTVASKWYRFGQDNEALAKAGSRG
jgi:hypothetical protein